MEYMLPSKLRPTRMQARPTATGQHNHDHRLCSLRLTGGQPASGLGGFDHTLLCLGVADSKERSAEIGSSNKPTTLARSQVRQTQRNASFDVSIPPDSSSCSQAFEATGGEFAKLTRLIVQLTSAASESEPNKEMWR
ncbi:unnamed protein product [Protopolystoma xenopodis]|uniref:Uncharacterized protein n=1 Tax=Protopolystoma xenopodis TaxID=117903 RepID=A0A3S5FDZ1_9PLAT|nr:unnamed protein product [Protopolystoma xenopodis]